MGLFGSIVHAVAEPFEDVAHAASSAWHATTDFVGDHWREIATIAATVVVGVGLTVLLGPAGLGLATVLAAGIGGLGAGATGYAVSWLLTPDRPAWSWGDFAKATLVSGALAVATAGVGEFIAPSAAAATDALVPQAVRSAVPQVVRSAATNAAAGTAFGAGSQVVLNAIEGRPLDEGVGTAAATGGLTGAVVGPVLETVVAPRLPSVSDTTPAAPSQTRGLVGALDGEGAGARVPAPPDPAVIARGAGAREDGLLPGQGGVEPLSPITGPSRLSVDSWNAQVEGVRRPGALVLSDEELAALSRGRGAPSNTLRAGETGDLGNFESAAHLVNDYVRGGEDLSLERIAAINRTLLSGTSNDANAGVYRDASGLRVGHGGGESGFFEYAAPEQVPAYLDDFLGWYRANEGRLPPSELAAEAYQQLVRIHPFVDSNGRTTRFVMDWILQRNGLPPATWTSADPEAVHSTTDWVVYNVDRGVLDSNQVLATTRTSDTSAQPGLPPPPPPRVR